MNNEENIIFLQFELVEANQDYLLIVYQDLGDSTNKLVVVKLGDLADDIKILTHSISTIQGVKIIQDKLYNYYYSSSEPKKFVVEVYSLGSTSITGPNDPTYEIYNVDNTAIENEIIMPQDYVITQAFGNALTADNSSATPSFFMIAKNDTEVNTNKFNYFLFQFDINYNSRKGLDFSEYAEIQNSTILPIEETEIRDPDILEIKENVIDNIPPNSIYYVSYILENSILAIYHSHKKLYLKIYDDYDFIEHEIQLTEENINNLQVISSFSIHTLIWETTTHYYLIQFEYQGSGEIKILVEKEFTKVSGKTMTNIINLEESIVFGYFDSTSDKYLIVKIEDGIEENILELPSYVNLFFIHENNDIIHIFTRGNTYQLLNLDNQELDSKYILHAVTHKNIVFCNHDLYYLGKIGDKLHIIKNNESILNLGVTEIEILEFKKQNDVNSLILIYTAARKYTKTILTIDLQTYHIHKNDFSFKFYTEYNNLFLLFDAREFNHKITIRYVNRNLETLYLNQFQNQEYNFGNLGLLKTVDNNVEFWGIQKDEDDIEDSNLIQKLNYVNISVGKYPTYSYLDSQVFTDVGDQENIFMNINSIDTKPNNSLYSERSVLTDNNLVLELVAEVSVVSPIMHISICLNINKAVALV